MDVFYGETPIKVKSNAADGAVLFTGIIRNLNFTFNFSPDNYSIDCNITGLAIDNYFPFHILESAVEEYINQIDRVYTENPAGISPDCLSQNVYSFEKLNGEVLFTARLLRNMRQEWFVTAGGGKRKCPPYSLRYYEKTQGIGYAESIYLDPIKQLIAAGIKRSDETPLTCDNENWYYAFEEYIQSGIIFYPDGRQVIMQNSDGNLRLQSNKIFKPGVLVKDYVEINNKKFWYVADYSETSNDNQADATIVFESDYAENAHLRFEGKFIRQSVKRVEKQPGKNRGYIAYYRIQGVITTVGSDGREISENIDLYNNENVIEEIATDSNKRGMFSETLLNDSRRFTAYQQTDNSAKLIGLDDLIGLESVKQSFEEFRKYAGYKQKLSVVSDSINNDGDKLLDLFKREPHTNASDIKSQDDISLHMVFLGSPGTGKSSVALRVAKMLKEYGFLTNDVPLICVRSDLVGQHIGETEAIVRKKIKEATGGVLFIDEAYTLFDESCGNDFGKIALNEIMYAMEKYHIVIILAGYTDEMLHMLKHANTGISSRINFIFSFSDFSVEEMWAILQNKVESNGYRFDANNAVAIQGKVMDCFTVLKKELNGIKIEGKTHHIFGNGRGVKKFYQYMTIGLAVRLANEKNDNDLRTFTIEDVDFAYQKFESTSAKLKEEKVNRIGFDQN